MDKPEEIPGRLPVGIFRFKDEYDQVGGRHEALGDLLMLFDDGIGARRIDDGDLAQDVDRQQDLLEVGVDGDDLLLFAVSDLLHRIGNGLRRHLRDLLPGGQQGVYEAALARFYFPDDDEHEGFVNAVAQIADGAGQLVVLDSLGQFVQVLHDLVDAGPPSEQLLVEYLGQAGRLVE